MSAHEPAGMTPARARAWRRVQGLTDAERTTLLVDVLEAYAVDHGIVETAVAFVERPSPVTFANLWEYGRRPRPHGKGPCLICGVDDLVEALEEAEKKTTPLRTDAGGNPVLE